MPSTIRLLEILSKSLYWISMAGVAAAVLTFLKDSDRQVSYAFALLSVVLMMGSSALLYIRNILKVGKEIAADSEKKAPEDATENCCAPEGKSTEGLK